jgi:hypothetical protein
MLREMDGVYCVVPLSTNMLFLDDFKMDGGILLYH